MAAAELIGLAVAWAVIWIRDKWNEHAARPDVEWAVADLDDAVTAFGSLPPGLTLDVRLYESPRGKGTRIRIAGVWPRFTMDSRPSASLEIGDPVFDQAFHVRGPVSALHATLDAATRGALLALARDANARRGSMNVSGGVLAVDAPRPRAWQPLARAAIGVALRLREPAGVAPRLLANAREDPEGGVRRWNLRALVREYPQGDETRVALAAALDDADPEVRLEAALASRVEGRPVLLALAADERVDDSCSARAVDGLSPVSLEELRGIADAALAEGVGGPCRPHTARACAALLGLVGEEAVPLLARALASGNTAVGLAAIRSLERIGTSAAVLPLMQASEAGEEAVRAAAVRALEEIQLGLTGAPGAVSLTDGGAGSLSMVEDPSGRVSLPAAPSRERV